MARLVSRSITGLKTLPHDPADPCSAALHEAWQRGRRVSNDLLRELLWGFDLAEEAQRSDGGTLQVGRRPIDLATWIDAEKLLDEAFTRQDLAETRVKLVKDRERPDAETVLDHLGRDESFAVAPASRLAAVLDEGNTLVMDSIDRRDRTLRRFGEHIGRIFGSPNNINAYVSMRPHTSFGAHWDDHEVLIIQLIGRKRWQVHEPTTLSPHKSIFSQYDVGRTMWNEVIAPGDFLYIPRGWGHTVSGIDELTFHLTVTMPRVMLPGLFVGLLRQAPEGPIATSSFLVRPGEPLPPVEDLASYLDSLAVDRRLDQAMAAFWANLKPAFTHRLSALLAALEGRTAPDDLWVRTPHPGGVHLAVDRNDVSHLAFGARAASGEPADFALLAPYTDGRTHCVAAMADRLGSDAHEIVADGLRIGLFEVVEDIKSWGVLLAD